MKEFSQKTKEELKHYVYCLVDPNDNKIFYVGKGEDGRVFAHVNGVLKEETEDTKNSDGQQSLKIDKIQEIHKKSNKVQHYIIRHGLSEKLALEIEATLIDLFNYESLSLSSFVDLTNIQSGHHSFDRGIATVEELEKKYDCEEIKQGNIKHKLLLISLNKTYEEGEDLYEATRKNWRVNKERAEAVDYIIAEYKGISRAIFKANEWKKSPDVPNRKMFEGETVNDETIKELYLNKSFSQLKSQGSQNPLRYFDG